MSLKSSYKLSSHKMGAASIERMEEEKEEEEKEEEKKEEKEEEKKEVKEKEEEDEGDKKEEKEEKEGVEGHVHKINHLALSLGWIEWAGPQPRGGTITGSWIHINLCSVLPYLSEILLVVYLEKENSVTHTVGPKSLSQPV